MDSLEEEEEEGGEEEEEAGGLEVVEADGAVDDVGGAAVRLDTGFVLAIVERMRSNEGMLLEVAKRGKTEEKKRRRKRAQRMESEVRRWWRRTSRRCWGVSGR